MFHRRFAHGFYPLLVWADDEVAADICASIHARMLPPIVLLCPSRELWDRIRAELEERSGA